MKRNPAAGAALVGAKCVTATMIADQSMAMNSGQARVHGESALGGFKACKARSRPAMAGFSQFELRAFVAVPNEASPGAPVKGFP